MNDATVIEAKTALALDPVAPKKPLRTPVLTPTPPTDGR